MGVAAVLRRPLGFTNGVSTNAPGCGMAAINEAQDFNLSANLADILQSGAFPKTPSRSFSAGDRGCLLAVGRNEDRRVACHRQCRLCVRDEVQAACCRSMARSLLARIRRTFLALLLVIGFASRKAALTLLGMKRRHRDLRLSRCLAEPRHLGRLLPRHHRRRARKTIHRSFHRPSHRRHDLRAKLSALGRSGGCSNGAGRHRKSRKSGTC